MNLELLLTATGGALALTLFGILAGLLCMGVDRILAARMQARIGPPLRQPFLDMLKLMCKQNIVPEGAIPAIFNAAPVVALASAVSILFYIPMGPAGALFEGRGDLVLILYLLVIPALSMVAGGLASGSPYATIGAQREMVTMIAYELPLASTIIAVAWRVSHAGGADPFSLATIAAHPIWEHLGPLGWIGFFLLLLSTIVVTPGELGRIPFDTPEAETELAGGLLVEYSGRNLALFHLALAVKTIAMLALVVIMFFPYPASRWIHAGSALSALADTAFFFLKILVLMFISVSLIRVAVARFRINQVVDLYWKYIGVLSLVGVLLVVLDAQVFKR